jgi:capsular exopolysaccharide synthesis family protein
MNTQESGLSISPTGKPRSSALSSSVSQPLIAVSEADKAIDFGQMFAVLLRRMPIILGTTVIAIGLAYWWARSRPASYQGNFEVLVQNNSAENRLVSAVPQNSGLPNTATVSGLRNDTTLLTVLVSPKLLHPVWESLKTQYPDLSYKDLAQGLVLENPSKTNILRVTFSSNDPTLVKKVLEAVSRSYLNYSLESRRTDTVQGLRFVQDQLPILQKRVNSLQLQLQRFRQSYNLSDPNTQSGQLSTQISSLYQQRYENRIALQEAQASYADIQQQLKRVDAYRLASSSLVRNANYQRIRNQLIDLDNQIAQQSVIYSPDYPGLKNLKEQRQKLIPLLAQEADQAVKEMNSGIRDLLARREALTQTHTSLTQNMKQLSLRTREYNDLQRELGIATNNLTQFLSKRESLRIEAAQQEIPWELTTPPTNPSPVLVGTPRVLALGGLTGLLLGVGIAFLVDKARNVFYTPKEIKLETTLPLLGILPAASEVRRLAGSDSESQFTGDTLPYRSTPFLEATRSLYASLRLLNVDKPIRSLTITSVNPNDGKTTIAIHLAQIAASVGLKVLLVDTDLRNPQVHQFLNLENRLGLTDLMTDSLNLPDVVQRVSRENQFYVLSAGQIPPDPLRVLASVKMKHLMAKFSTDFDLVIYDTPPALDLADANVLSSQTDGVALVVRLGNTERSDFVNTLESLGRSSTIVHGVVVNGWKSNSTKRSYYSSQKRTSARQLTGT